MLSHLPVRLIAIAWLEKNMARYLITGIAGFIGSSLAHELVRLGHDVRGVDNLSCGNLRNLDPILDDIDFRQMDINDTECLRDFCHSVDYVLHQAAIASVPRSVQDPIGSHIANIDGTLSVLIAARDAGVKRVVYAASSSAYGAHPVQPKHEAMLPSPLSPYAAQKLAGEQYVKSFWHVYGLEGICLRYFNVFGPKQSADSPYSGVIARFISDMLAGTVPTIFGTGAQSRDFTSIRNVVSANLLACTAPRGSACGEVFNIGTGSSQTLNTLYSAVANMLQFSRAASYTAVRSGDIEHSQADISRARQTLGYTPLESFEEGLRRTVDWYVEQSCSQRVALLC
jgi:nucleoside-diphosphate-sugar epimerase